MIRTPERPLVEALRAYAAHFGPGATQSSIEFREDTTNVILPALNLQGRLIVPLECEPGTSLAEVAALFGQNHPPAFSAPGLHQVLIAVDGDLPPRTSPEVVALGIRAVPLHEAIAEVIGLPAGWRDHQLKLVEQTLRPVHSSSDGTFQIAPLTFSVEGEAVDAQRWMDSALAWVSDVQGWLLYVQAEAGKGKSTILADHVRRRLGMGRGPLPLLVPLRELQRGAGVSWEAIAASIGVVGASALNLSQAVRTGLVAILLDGLDEVAGRYDPNVVKQVIRLVGGRLLSETSHVAISGRTTEGTLLDPGTAVQIDIELPEVGGGPFRQYASVVIRATVPTWPSTARQLPEPPLSADALPDRPITERQVEDLLDWVQNSFESLGKDRSLFFVQSLACIGRTRQLQGKYLINPQAAEPVASCSLYEVCILAASLACVREREKVESMARSIFPATGQLDLLTWFALLASSGGAARDQLGRPNELAQVVFEVDAVNQNEEFTAILRQMQKHALLYGTNDGQTVGDWRPSFLSEWIRGTFLVRAWLEQDRLASGGRRDLLRAAVVQAENSQIAFRNVFTDAAHRSPASVLEGLVSELVKHANSGSPEACSNYWSLMIGLDEERRSAVPDAPQRIVDLSDLNEAEFEGMSLGESFSGNLAMFVASRFVNCELSGCSFTSCDLTNAHFEGCRLSDVSLEFCTGPVFFEDCEFTNCTFKDGESNALPIWSFSDCRFRPGSRIDQTRQAAIGSGFGPVAAFQDSLADDPVPRLVQGDWAGFTAGSVEGIQRPDTAPERDPAVDCLRRLLRTFFPSRVGFGNQRQVRQYIRSSAIGRGAFPVGSPSAGALASVLESEGFTDGGRSDHLYAPWSSVAGGTRLELRNEMGAFLRTGEMAPAIQRMVNRIRDEGNW